MLKSIISSVFAVVFTLLCGNFAEVERQETGKEIRLTSFQSSRTGSEEAMPSTTIFTSEGVECVFEVPALTRGITCTIAVSLKGDGRGTVFGIAKNSFTLGPSTIPVYIVLRSAETKTGIDLNGTPENYNYIADLNIWKSIECGKSTNGKAKYWQAHAYWNLDYRGWQHGSTPVSYYDANAVFDKNK